MALSGHGWNWVEPGEGHLLLLLPPPQRAQPPLTRAVSQHYIKAQSPTPAPSWIFGISVSVLASAAN